MTHVEFEIVDCGSRVAAAWDELADGRGAPPFSRPGWYQAFRLAFGAPRHALVARRGGAVVGVVPIDRRVTSVRSPTNWHTPRFDAVAEDDGVAFALGAWLVRHGRPCVDLSFVDAAGPFATGLIEEARGRRRPMIVRPLQRSPYVLLDGDFAAYEATLDSRLRASMRRRRRRLEERGTVELAFEDGTHDLEHLLDEGFAVEGSGWKTELGTAIVQDARVERLYRCVARFAADRGWLELGFLRVNGHTAAFTMVLSDHQTVWCLKMGFDPAFRTCAVGTLMIRETIRRACADGARVVDFLGSDEPYKLEWTGLVQEVHRLQVFTRSPAGLATYTAWRHGRPIARRLTRPDGDHRNGERHRRDADDLPAQ